jgi:hypothetical protein
MLFAIYGFSTCSFFHSHNHFTNGEGKRLSAVSCPNSVNQVNNGNAGNIRFEVFMDVIILNGCQ